MKAEPVAILDIVKGAVAILGFVGVTVPDDTAVKVGAGIVALVFFVQTTWATRKRVTPEAKAVERVEAAKEETAAAVTQLFTVADPAPEAPAPPVSTITVKPSVGLADHIQAVLEVAPPRSGGPGAQD